MRLEKKPILLVSLMLIAVVTVFAALQRQSPTKQPQSNSRTEDDPRPIVDYADSNSPHNKNDSKRHAKGKRYNEGTVQKNGTDGGLVTHFNDFEFAISAIPAEMSDAVVVGTVLNAAAYLSPDATGVYSEFTIKVDEVMKDRSGSISADTSLAVDREGGRVRYPSGAVVDHIISGQGTPRVNRRYVLFLRHEEEGFRILTGYELGAGGVNPLDRIEKFKKHKGVDATAFLNQVRSATNSSSSDTPGTGR